MNKTETIDHIALSADLSKEAAGRVMDAFEARLKAHTAEGKRVVFRGFGSFSRGLPAQKTGRNPRTGASVLIRAARVPRFHASKTGNTGGKFSAGEGLKAAVN